MLKLRIFAVAGTCLALLVGCEGWQSEVEPPIAQASRIEPNGSEFSKNLFAGYLKLAKVEQAEGNQAVSDAYAVYALNVANQKIIEPEPLSNLWLPPNTRYELEQARSRLMTALSSGARKKAPSQAADAQVMLVCWMKAQEENRQQERISACRSGFFSGMQALRAAMVTTIAKYTVYFPLNSSRLTAKSRKVILEAIDAAKESDGARISLFGHADKSGDAQYNIALAGKRVTTIFATMKNAGVSPDLIDWKSMGESVPAVPTADGVPNRENRRVEIVIQK